jgi:cyclopropane fatty-acyl-phospholipid synthase-like methyltransferase
VVTRFAAAAFALIAWQAPARTPDIYFVGTPQPVVEAMLRLAGVQPTDVVYDLGSGDGRIPIIAAQQCGARGVGIEIQPRLVAASRQTAVEGGVADRVTFIQGDLFDADLSGATVVTMWLTDAIDARLAPKLRQELKPGSRIVSHQFRMGDWAPDRSEHVDGEDIFLWIVPPHS